MTGRLSRFPVTDLPAVIPIFPLTDALLLPGGRLPLNIFEPRYVAMTADALAGDRIIGMVQPLEPDAETRDREPEVYATGCAGRITGFEESEDDRFEIDLTGLCRFEIARELPGVRGYRQVVARWDRFAGDLDDEDPGSIARGPLITALTEFLTPRGVETDWEAIDDLADAELVTWLAMFCPFRPSEKQALLECPNLAERARLLATLMEMAAHEGGYDELPRQ
jgi:Lon protease-like protein